MPLVAAINATDADSPERNAAETAERALLHVSATRRQEGTDRVELWKAKPVPVLRMNDQP